MKPRELSKISPEQRQVIEKYLADIPVKLGSLARELGVSAVKIASMKTGVSGQITKEDDKYIIRVNRNEARERQRFTIAHELAHYLLHRQVIDQFRDGITDNVLYRSGAPERVEYEANKLAADLVMPRGDDQTNFGVGLQRNCYGSNYRKARSLLRSIKSSHGASS